MNFSEFAKKCSNEYIFVFPLENLYFRGYVRGGRWVGEVSQTMYARVKKGEEAEELVLRAMSIGEALREQFHTSKVFETVLLEFQFVVK